MSVSDPHSLNEIVHGQTRLKVLKTLSIVPSIEFVVLRDQLKVSDGALSVAVKKLEDAKFVKTTKTHEFGKSKTTIHLTKLGMKEFENYLAQLYALLNSASKQPLSAAK